MRIAQATLLGIFVTGLLAAAVPATRGQNADDSWTVLAALLCAAVAGGALFLQERRSRTADAANLRLLESQLTSVKRLIDGVPGGWLRMAAAGRVDASPMAAQLLGFLPANRAELFERLDIESRRHLESIIRSAQSGDVTLVSLDGRALRAVLLPEGGGNWAVWLFDLSAERATLSLSRSETKAAHDRVLAFGRLLDALPIPVWMRSAEARLTWVNRAYADATEAGTQSSALIELFPRISVRLAQRALAARVPQSMREHVVVLGERRLYEVTEVPMATMGDGSGTIIGYALDFTDFEDLQAELGRHLSGHAEILEQLGSAIVIFGPDTRLRFHNRAYLRLSRLDETWLEGNPSFGDVLEELRVRRRIPEEANFPRYKRDMLGLFTSLIEPRESLLHLPDGTTLRQLVVPHPFGGLMFVQEDVTDRLQLESSYNTLLAVQQESLDNLAEGIAVFGGNGRLRLTNPPFRRIWGLQESSLEEAPHLSEVLALLQPFVRDSGEWAAFTRVVQASAFDREQSSGRIDRSDGIVLRYATIPLPDGAVMVSFLDITDTVHVEVALRKSNAALEAADRLKSEFIANVSYQLRTPLNAIMGFAEILQRGYFGDLNERQKEYVNGLIEAGQQLLALINDILDLATIEAGFMTLDRDVMDVGAVMRSVHELTSEWARKEDLTLLLQVPPGIGEIEADERRIKQALFNLVSNAIKFTPRGGTITMSAERHDGELWLSVSDTGIGIAAKDQRRVFERFERAHPEQSQPGAGLGLSVVKSFIELHGGQVHMTSEPQRGTRIDCILPIIATDTSLPLS